MRNSGKAADGRTIKLKHRILAGVYDRQRVMFHLLDLLEMIAKLTKIPFLSKYHPFTNIKNNHMVNLPVNAGLAYQEQVVPQAILYELINRSEHFHILDHCLCRHGKDCKKHNHDIGCLFLGQTGTDVSPLWSRKATREEALEHVQRGLADGLMPMTARIRVDNYAFLLKDTHHLIGVCFCCDCCCFMSYYRHVPLDALEKVYPKLEGLQVVVNDNCAGCGSCVETCYMRAIEIRNGRAVHLERCRGCGRCTNACVNKAVTLTVTDPLYYEKTVNAFLSIADLK